MALIIITTVSILLGILTPTVFIYVIQKGINNSKFDRVTTERYSSYLWGTVLLWVFVILAVTFQGLFSYHENDFLPRFIIALTFPIIAIVLLLRSKDFITILNNISLSHLVGGQFWRVFGTVFFVVALTGFGPESFISSGFGDLITGILAITAFWVIRKRLKSAKLFAWATTLFGLLDLTIILYILFTNYPIWSDAVPNTAAAGAFPLMLIVGLAAPVALQLHAFTIKKLLISKSQSNSRN
jgi:hypothetical protein